MKLAFLSSLLFVCAVPLLTQAQAPAAPPHPSPEWAQPGSATHTQVSPPQPFTARARISSCPSASSTASPTSAAPWCRAAPATTRASGKYTINSAGYNIWYTRDEFRYLWKKMSGDVSLAADIAYPDPNGYGDRKAVLVIRQDLEDDSKEAIVALHGAGMIHLAQRPEKGVRVKDMEYRIGGRGLPGGASPDSLVTVMAQRIGIEKHGDRFCSVCQP